MFLFLAKLIGKTSSVSHGLLGAVLSGAQLAVHLIQIGLHGVDVGLQLALLAREGADLGGQLVDAVVGVGQLVLGCLASTLSLKEREAKAGVREKSRKITSSLCGTAGTSA